MPRQTPHPQPARGARAQRPRRPGRESRPPTPPLSPETAAPTAHEADADRDAQRALLASPAVIAKGTRRAAAPRPRTKPRTKAADAAPAPASSPAPTAPAAAAAQPVAPAEPVSPTAARSTAALLDATRARRLAREAHLREQASRASLARTRAALATPILPEPRPTPPVADAPGWQRRPLGQPIDTDARPALAPEPAQPPIPALRGSGIPPVERALAAELREAKATLAIARETTQLQREEITRLRAALEASPSNAAPEAHEAIADSPAEAAERAELRGRITALEAELERAALERAELHRAMAAHQQELALRSRRHAALQERYDVLEQTLDQTRRQAEQERRRHTEAQTLLDRLRATLHGAELERPAAEAAPVAIVAVPAPAALPAVAVAGAGGAADAGPLAAAPASAPRPAPAASDTDASARAPIFSYWLDEQVRRNFGPLGLDSLADLLRAPLERRTGTSGAPLPILLAGRGVTRDARGVADALVRAGVPAFVLCVADPDPEAGAGRSPLPGEDDPLRGMIRRCAFPDRAEELSERLRELAPAVVMTRELLTWQADVAPWLEALRTATRAGTALVLLEQTGHGAVTPSAELVTIGERIWELLPERYTRNPATGETIGRFRDAFAARPTPPRNALLQRLREGFALELCAQFGFLAEAFVGGPIAACFDAREARDQRFVKQIADVDERRLEAGSATALHLIARVDPRLDPAL